MANKLFYTGHLEHNGGYTHLSITVMEHNSFYSTDTRNGISFRWQHTNGEDGWYAGKVELAAESYDQFMRKSKLFRRVTGKEMSFSYSPENLLEKLERIGIEVKFDGRLSEYTPIADIPDPLLKRYRNTPITGEKYSQYFVLAKNYENAQQQILTEAAEKGDTQFIKRWLGEGQNVQCSSFDKAPDTTTIREMLAKPELN